MRWAGSGCALLSLWFAACTPALNWREWNLPGTATLALFPCRPLTATRNLLLVGQRVTMQLHSCDADSAVWAVASAQLGDPALVTPALQELRTQAAQHIGAALPAVTGWAVAGATPNSVAGRVVLQGQLPDGRRVFEHQGVFAHGTQVFQATVIGSELGDSALAVFFEGLRVRP